MCEGDTNEFGVKSTMGVKHYMTMDERGKRSIHVDRWVGGLPNFLGSLLDSAICSRYEDFTPRYVTVTAKYDTRVEKRVDAELIFTEE